jgi:hypothetical protein
MSHHATIEQPVTASHPLAPHQPVTAPDSLPVTVRMDKNDFAAYNTLTKEITRGQGLDEVDFSDAYSALEVYLRRRHIDEGRREVPASKPEIFGASSPSEAWLAAVDPETYKKILQHNIWHRARSEHEHVASRQPYEILPSGQQGGATELNVLVMGLPLWRRIGAALVGKSTVKPKVVKQFHFSRY